MNKRAKGIAAAVAAGLAVSAAADGFETPTMGWSSWNTYRVEISDSLICGQADAMVATGLAAAGYDHVNIDDGFFGGRDADGRLLVHPVRFPRGLVPVVAHVHSLGLKAGIYSDAGRNTCGNFWDSDTLGVGVGFYGHDLDDARLYFDDLGFDFIKIDFCGGDAAQNTEHLGLDERERYTAIRAAIDSTGHRDVRVNVCRWAFPGTWVRSVGSSWRIAGDIGPNWQSVKRIIAANNYLSAYAGEGHYNDMDMLEIGRGLTDAEERTHFGIWCMMSSPLLIGCDLTSIPARSLELVTNPELIALDRDRLGLQARVVRRNADGVALYVKDIEQYDGPVRAVAVYNPSDSAADFSIDLAADLDLTGRVAVRDLFARRELPPIEQGRLDVRVGPHDTAIFRLKGESRAERTVYEAETAWLERFNCLGDNPADGHAIYVDDPACSGGARVAWLGNHPDNHLEWRDVWSRTGGEYELTVECAPEGGDAFRLSVNGSESVALDRLSARSVRVLLRPGFNTIRISNPSAPAPDIDRLTVRAVAGFGKNA